MARSNHSHKIKSTPLAFFGTAEFSLYSLRSLVEQGFNVELVVTKPAKYGKRGRQKLQPAVQTYAQNQNIPCIQPPDKSSLLEYFNEDEHPLWGVVSAYGHIIPDATLSRFKGGLVNVHPSLLPKWRGPSPIESALLHGDSETGNSLIRLTGSMDAGPIYAQSKYPIPTNADRPMLYKALGQDGAKLLTDNLEQILAGEIKPTDQDDDEATYSAMLAKSDAKIDWHQPAFYIERQIRAFKGWPGSQTQINGVDITIETAEVLDMSGEAGYHYATKNDLIIYAKDKSLKINTLKPHGKSTMKGADFIRGYLD